jgi:hypothetical protein
MMIAIATNDAVIQGRANTEMRMRVNHTLRQRRGNLRPVTSPRCDVQARRG